MAVPVEPVRCVSVVSAGRGPVYCLDEPATHAFTIEGGLIVHNCADEWRYACASRPWIREPEEDEEPVFEQQLPVGKQIERHITHKRRSKEPERI